MKRCRLGIRLVMMAALVVGALASAPPAFAEKRVALVVGNNAYAKLPTHMQLDNAINDAKAVRDTLRALGFDVIYGENLDRKALVDRTFDLASRLSAGDTAFFFFAGHGVSFSGANYLLPSDIPAPRGAGRAEEGRLADQALSEAQVIERITASGARVAIFVLDACRDNPLQSADLRSLGATRGLAPAAPPRGVFSIYSAGFGQAALDRLGPDDRNPNSVFTRVFIEKLKTPGIDLKVVATETRRTVADLAEKVGREQFPAYYDQIVGGDVFLAGLPRASEPVSNRPTDSACADAAAHFRAVEAIGTQAAFEDHLARFGACSFAGLAQAKIESLRTAQEQRASEARAQDARAQEERARVERDRRAAEGAARKRAEEDANRRRAAEEGSRKAAEDRRRDAEAKSIAALAPPAAPPAAASAPASPAATSPALATPPATIKSVNPRGTQVLSGHTGTVRSIAFSPDGRLVVSGGADKSARVWDVETGRLIHTVPKFKNDIMAVAFSPDGRLWAAATLADRSYLFDATTGKQVRSIESKVPRIAAFSPDGRQLLSNLVFDLGLFDVTTGKEVRRIDVGTNVEQATFSPDGRTILVITRTTGRTEPWLLSAETGSIIQRFKDHGVIPPPADRASSTHAAVFSPDGRKVATGGDDKIVRLATADSGCELWSSRMGAWVRALAFAPDGRWLAVGLLSGGLVILDAATGNIVRKLEDHDWVVNAVAVSPDGRYLAAANGDNTVRISDLGPAGPAAAR